MSEIISLKFDDTNSSESSTAAVGRRGEDLAARHLERCGYRLVCSNFRAPVGRNRRGAQVTGEIDLVALDGEVLCFVEVKTRTSADFAFPVAAVDRRKQRQITRTARVFRRVFGLQSVRFRYDVVSIILSAGKAPLVELFRGFWTEDIFRKKYWLDERPVG